MIIKTVIQIGAPDIPTMYEMSEMDYETYISDEGIFFINDGVVREASTDRPLATHSDQLEILIHKLEAYRFKINVKKNVTP